MKKIIIFVLSSFLLFSCSDNISQDTSTKSQNNNGNFSFECIKKNSDEDSDFKYEMMFNINNLNSSIMIDSLKTCYNDVILEDFEKYSIPEKAFIAAKNNSDIYFMKLEEKSGNIIISKGTFYSENHKVNFIDYKIIEFDDKGQIKI